MLTTRLQEVCKNVNNVQQARTTGPVRPHHNVPKLGVMGLILSAALLAAASAQAVTDTLISMGSDWKYLDDGSDQETGWSASSFNDNSWASGPAQLGYGDGDEATEVSYGPNRRDKYVTTYFRHTFNVSNPSTYTVLRLSVIRDDGIVVYLNGTEVFRDNLPSGAIAHDTYALTAIGGSDESAILESTVNPNLLVSGDNVIAVEIHQADATSSDISFDLELLASTDPVINDPPSVSIGSPADNAFYTTPASFPISAAASDPDGSINLVEFYAGTAKLGEDNSSPFTYDWNNVSIGNYALTAVATDNLGARATSAVVHVTVNISTPPTIASVNPPAGTVHELTNLTVTFSEPVQNVDAADLLINGLPAPAVSGSGAIYTFTFPSPREGTVLVAWNGAHGITDYENPPRAFDQYGSAANWQYTLTDTVAPTATQVSPMPNATLRALLKIKITFSEPVVGVDAADLLINNTPAVSVSGTGAGPYEFSLVQPTNTTAINVTWAGGHGITDQALTPRAFVGGSWSYTLNDTAVFEDRVVINEIMYHPASERTDEEFVELLNTGSSAVNLTGWRLNRGVDFTFPNVSLAAGGFLVVAADVTAFNARYPGVANVVGNWDGRLSNSGEEIELEDASGDRVDLVAYADEGDFALRRPWPTDTRGWEWYAEHDGLGKSLELRNPALPNNHGQNWGASADNNGSPGQANSLAASNVAPLVLDVAHFPAIPRSTDTITITARVVDEQTNGITVKLWSRDASSESAPPFGESTMFDDGAHNDGVAGDGIYGAILGPLANETVEEFYVQATDANSNRRTWPAAAQVTGGGFEQRANAIFQVDDEDYAGAQPVYRIIMTEEERVRLADGSRNSDAQMNATLVSRQGDSVKIRYNCGLRYRGAGSRGRAQPSYRLNIPSDRPWNGVTSANLNSQYTHAQMIGSAVALQAGLPTEIVRPIQLRVNAANPAPSGSPTFGSYVHVEPLNGEWAENHFPQDSAGNVYRASSGSHQADLTYQGTDPASYISRGYYKTANASENDWSDFMALILALNPSTTPDSEYVAAVKHNANVELWLRYFAVLSLMDYSETSLGSGYGDDFGLYRGLVDPRFMVVAHDFDTVFDEGDTGGNASEDIFVATRLPIVDRFLHNPEFEAMYYAELRHQLTTTFSTNNLLPLFDQLLGDWVPANNIANMKNFVVQRNAYVLSQLPAEPNSVRATIVGEPVSPTFQNSAVLTVGGQDITHYKYRLNNGAWGSETMVSTPIALSGLADGTYTVYVIGRNSSGTWQAEADATVSQTWAVLSNLKGVVINEVLARNDTAFEYQGTFPDLVELFNASSTPMNLEGLRLTDDLADPNKFVFPAGASVAAGQYLMLFANNPDGTAGIHLGFALNQLGETLYLLDKSANASRVLDQVTFGVQLADQSIGRLSNGQWGL